MGPKTTTKNTATTDLDDFINRLKLCGADSPHLTHIERVILIQDCMEQVTQSRRKCMRLSERYCDGEDNCITCYPDWEVEE
jgi:hypothetical protein